MHRITRSLGFSLNSLESCVSYPMPNLLKSCHRQEEIEVVQIALKILDDENDPLPGYQEILCHLIFTVKMEDFRIKACYVAGGHQTEAPATLMYACVVSRETVQIALMLAALNGLEVKTSNIQNTYLTAPCAEKIWT